MELIVGISLRHFEAIMKGTVINKNEVVRSASDTNTRRNISGSKLQIF